MIVDITPEGIDYFENEIPTTSPRSFDYTILSTLYEQGPLKSSEIFMVVKSPSPNIEKSFRKLFETGYIEEVED